MKFLLLSLVFIAHFTFAESIESMEFSSVENEKRYHTLITEIRCPVCQGQSIGGSNASLAKDLRLKTKEMIENNKTNIEIKKFMTDRYGDFVTFTPPVKQSTLVLWIAPFVLVILAVFLFFKNNNKRADNTDVIDVAEIKKLLELK